MGELSNYIEMSSQGITRWDSYCNAQQLQRCCVLHAAAQIFDVENTTASRDIVATVSLLSIG